MKSLDLKLDLEDHNDKNNDSFHGRLGDSDVGQLFRCGMRQHV